MEKTALSFLHHWWPAFLLGWIAYMALNFLRRPRVRKGNRLTEHGVAIHQIQTTLACTEAQARNLLEQYSGDVARAILEVKTGRAVLPGSESSELARFGGDVKAISVQGGTAYLLTHDGRNEELDTADRSTLLVGVVDPEQRADACGAGRADRGQVFGQLYWRRGEEWQRFLLTGSRMDYTVLGDRKVNSAVRNFRQIVQDLMESVPGLTADPSVSSFLQDLRAPLYKRLADFDAQAAKLLKSAESPEDPK